MLFIVTIAYPTLNSILTVLALMILLGIKNEKHHFIPWICELVGFLAIVVGDSWFAIVVLTAFVEQIWMSALLLSAHYLLIAAGLIWYLRYTIKWQSKDILYKIIINIRGRNETSKKVLFSSIIIISFLIFAGFYYTNVFSGDEDKDFFIKRVLFILNSPPPHHHHLSIVMMTILKRNLLLVPFYHSLVPFLLLVNLSR